MSFVSFEELIWKSQRCRIC